MSAIHTAVFLVQTVLLYAKPVLVTSALRQNNATNLNCVLTRC